MIKKGTIQVIKCRAGPGAAPSQLSFPSCPPSPPPLVIDQRGRSGASGSAFVSLQTLTSDPIIPAPHPPVAMATTSGLSQAPTSVFSYMEAPLLRKLPSLKNHTKENKCALKDGSGLSPPGLISERIYHNKLLRWDCCLTAAVDSTKHGSIPANISKQAEGEEELSQTASAGAGACSWTYLSALERLFRELFGLRLLPRQGAPPGPLTLTASRPLEDFLKVNSRASPSLRLRKPSMCSLLCQGRTWRSQDQPHMWNQNNDVWPVRDRLGLKARFRSESHLKPK